MARLLEGCPAAVGGDITGTQLAAVLGTERAPLLVDVREPDEFAAWSIPGAGNVPLEDLLAHPESAAGDTAIVTVCASGRRSARAAEALRLAGIPAQNLTGGMQAWAGVYDTATCQAGAATIVQLRRRAKGCLSYVVGSGTTALVVDPSLDVDRYLETASANGWRVRLVVDTHLHADHVSGARALAAAAGASLRLSGGERYGFAHEPLQGGEQLAVGRSVVSVVGSPGHTKGSILLDVDGEALFTGDTVFVDGVGRPDLADAAEEFAQELHASLHGVVLVRDDGVRVLPAHFGPGVAVVPGQVVGATIGELRAALAPLSWDAERFVAWASTRATPRPPNYVEIVRVNAGEREAGSEECRGLELGPNRCAARRRRGGTPPGPRARGRRPTRSRGAPPG